MAGHRSGTWLTVSGMALGMVLGVAGCPSSGDDGPAASGSGDSTGDTPSTDTTAAMTTGTGPADDSGTAAVDESSSEDGGPPQTGELVVLTYNVAGLPQGISSSDPERNIPQISPLLDTYPLVLAQEDFWYHAELLADVTHPFISDPFPADPERMGIGDGLNRLSESEFSELERQQWYACNGQLDCSSDCLARKGWSFARHTLAEGVEVDVYNLHVEAGGCAEDLEIRLQSTLDLAEAIAERSADRALIVAGDFNLRATDPEDVQPLANIIDGAGLTDACDAVECGDQRIDHIMVRNGSDVTIAVEQWWVPEEFVDARTGEELSDHLPVAARLSWSG